MDCHAFEFMQRALQDLKKTAFNLDARVGDVPPRWMLLSILAFCRLCQGSLIISVCTILFLTFFTSPFQYKYSEIFTKQWMYDDGGDFVFET